MAGNLGRGGLDTNVTRSLVVLWIVEKTDCEF